MSIQTEHLRTEAERFISRAPLGSSAELIEASLRGHLEAMLQPSKIDLFVVRSPNGHLSLGTFRVNPR